MLLRRRQKRTVATNETAAALAAFAVALALVAIVMRLVRNRAAENAARTGFAVDPTTPVAGELRRVAREQVDGAEAVLSSVDGKVTADAVHDARKRLRRMRAVLRLTRHDLGDDVFGAEHQAIRTIAGRFAPARDAHVMVGTLDSLTTDFRDEVPAGAFDGFRAVLEANVRIEHERAAMQANAIGGAIAELRALRDRIAGWPLSERASVDLLAEGMASVHKRARKAQEQARAKPTSENLHRLRRRSKDLRHAVKLAGDGSEQAKQLDSDIHKLTDLLGVDHDLAVLREAAGTHAETMTPAHRTLLEALIDRRRAALQRRALKLSKELFTPKPPVATAKRAK